MKKTDSRRSLLSLELFSNGDSNISVGDEKMPEILSSGIKISNKDDDYRDLQRKKDLWKAKALRLIGFLDEKDKKPRSLKTALQNH